MRAGDLCYLAGELVMEHGAMALEYARRATLQCQDRGETDRAHFWFAMTVLLDDIAENRLDPRLPLTVH